jgi:phage-related protein
LASFFGSEIIFDNVPSSVFGLRLINFSTGKSDGSMGSESTIIKKYIPRRSKSYYYGRMQNIPLEISITLGAELPLDGKARSAIEKWLLGRIGYLPLSIVQSDIDNITFNVMFKQGTIHYFGNINRSLEIKCECDSPWGYEYPNILIKTYSGSAIVNESFTYFNMSDDSDYTKPLISFATSAIGTSFSLTNLTDNGRQFLFSGIGALETINVDNDKGIIDTSVNLLRMSNFNKKFFRLVPGKNDLVLAGGITNFSMTVNPAKKVGE